MWFSAKSDASMTRYEVLLLATINFQDHVYSLIAGKGWFIFHICVHKDKKSLNLYPSCRKFKTSMCWCVWEISRAFIPRTTFIWTAKDGRAGRSNFISENYVLVEYRKWRRSRSEEIQRTLFAMNLNMRKKKEVSSILDTAGRRRDQRSKNQKIFVFSVECWKT